MHLPALLQFLEGLSEHNNRPWFVLHKPAYDILREEFLTLVTGLVVGSSVVGIAVVGASVVAAWVVPGSLMLLVVGPAELVDSGAVIVSVICMSPLSPQASESSEARVVATSVRMRPE